MQFCTDLDNATCGVVVNSIMMGNASVSCSIKSFPPVDKGTYSCEDQKVEFTWKQTMGSTDIQGVDKYQAKALITNVIVSRFTGGSCRLTTANEYGQFNETLKEG